MPHRTICNFRSLGGLPAQGGRVRERALYRAADLTGVQPEQARWIAEDAGVRTYVDLRSRAEAERSGPPAALVAHGVRWELVPMDLANDDFWRIPQPGVADWVAMYTGGLERHRDDLARAVRVMADSEGAVVFGCWVGKDRTGVAAALVLSALGVPDEEIVADYARSQEGLRPHFDRFASLWSLNEGRREHIIQSYLIAHPEIMRDFLAGARARWGSLAAAAGLDDDTLARLRARFVAP